MKISEIVKVKSFDKRFKPILFSTEMVRAILDGRKTMTRRLVKEDKRGQWVAVNNACNHEYGASVPCYLHREASVDDKSRNIMYPKYDVGDILWIGEEIDMPTIYGGTVIYGKADGLKWRPSIHMPREAARIFLKVTNVRVERLKKITLEDIKKEGIKATGAWDCMDYLDAFAELWDSIYAEPKAVKNSDGEILYYKSYPWEDIQETKEYKGKPWYVYGNPWVFVYEFERVSEDGSSKDE